MTRADALRASLGWRLTLHARAAARRRGFSTQDILTVCVDPEITYSAFDYGPGRFVYQRGSLAVVVIPDSRIVVTVLLRSERQWDDEDARSAGRLGYDAA